MKLNRKISPNTIVDVEGETAAEIFEKLASMEEVFAIETCGCCGTGGARHQVRHVDDYTFFELVCVNQTCRARFSFGQAKKPKGTLFPQRKDKAGAWKPNGGWEKYTGGAQRPPQQQNDYTPSNEEFDGPAPF